MNGAAAKVMFCFFLSYCGKRYAKLTDVDRCCQIGTQKVPLSKNIRFAVTPLVQTPFDPLRSPRVTTTKRARGQRSRMVLVQARVYMCMYVYIYIYIYMYTPIYIYI